MVAPVSASAIGTEKKNSFTPDPITITANNVMCAHARFPLGLSGNRAHGAVIQSMDLVEAENKAAMLS